VSSGGDLLVSRDCEPQHVTGGNGLDKSMMLDILRSVDMRGGSAMKRLFGHSKEPAVEFCEGCSRLCDAVCRAAASREESTLEALRFGVRV
jgi:hypothetical protein